MTLFERLYVAACFAAIAALSMAYWAIREI
jgi:hypothetical protein